MVPLLLIRVLVHNLQSACAFAHVIGEVEHTHLGCGIVVPRIRRIVDDTLRKQTRRIGSGALAHIARVVALLATAKASNLLTPCSRSGIYRRGSSVSTTVHGRASIASVAAIALVALTAILRNTSAIALVATAVPRRRGGHFCRSRYTSTFARNSQG